MVEANRYRIASLPVAADIACGALAVGRSSPLLPGQALLRRLFFPVRA